MLAQVLTRLRALVQRRATGADLDEEIRYHVERDVERNVARECRRMTRVTRHAERSAT
jgi:hypothetical protein